MLISLVPWKNPLKCLNLIEEPFDGTVLIVELRIKPEWFPRFGYLLDLRLTGCCSWFLVSAVDGGIIVLNSSGTIVLTSPHKVFVFDPISPDLSVRDDALPSSLFEPVTISFDAQGLTMVQNPVRHRAATMI